MTIKLENRQFEREFDCSDNHIPGSTARVLVERMRSMQHGTGKQIHEILAQMEFDDPLNIATRVAQRLQTEGLIPELSVSKEMREIFMGQMRKLQVRGPEKSEKDISQFDITKIPDELIQKLTDEMANGNRVEVLFDTDDQTFNQRLGDMSNVCFSGDLRLWEYRGGGKSGIHLGKILHSGDVVPAKEATGKKSIVFFDGFIADLKRKWLIRNKDNVIDGRLYSEAPHGYLSPTQYLKWFESQQPRLGGRNVISGTVKTVFPDHVLYGRNGYRMSETGYLSDQVLSSFTHKTDHGLKLGFDQNSQSHYSHLKSHGITFIPRRILGVVDM